MLYIYTEMDWVMCWEWKDATSFDGNDNYRTTESWIQIHPRNQSKKNMQQASPFC